MNQKTKNIPLLFLVPFIIFILLCLGTSAANTLTNINLLINGKTTEGTVIGTKVSETKKSKPIRKPIIQFSVEGKNYQFTEEAGNWKPSSDLKGDVKVIYEENNPEKSSIYSFWYLWYKPLILVFVGSFFTFILILIDPRLKSLMKLNRTKRST